MFKAIIALILISVCTILANGNNTSYYVDATNGNDSNSGTSPATAWKSLTKVSNSSFSPGDSILFKRGEIWRGHLIINNSGLYGAPIVYGAYGEGDKPLFLQSANLNSTSDWTSLGSNRWASPNGSFISDVGFLLFGEEHPKNVGLKRSSQGNVDADKKYWYDSSNDRVVVFCEQNPASAYSSIEISKTNDIYNHFIGPWGISYIHIENWKIKYWNSHAIAFSNSKGIEIRKCDISYGGGCQRPANRYGNGIEFWRDPKDCIVEYCRVGQCYDTGVTPQGSNNICTVDNLIFRNNILYGNDLAGYEVIFTQAETSLTDMYFNDNICVGNGYGWSHHQRPDQYTGWDMCTWSIDPGTWDGWDIKNNVFYEPNSFAFYYAAKNRAINLDQDYNYYYKSAGIRSSLIYYASNDQYTMSQFPSYQSAKNQDINSGWGDRIAAQDTARSKVSCDDLFLLNTLFEGIEEELRDNLPYKFNLITPEDKASVGDTVILDWKTTWGTVSKLKHYELWIDCEHVADIPAGTSKYTATGLSEGEHKWFIVAVDNDNNWRQSSSESTFTVSKNPTTSAIWPYPAGSVYTKQTSLVVNIPDKYKIDLYDISGQKLHCFEGNGFQEYKVSEFRSTGVYLARIRAGQYFIIKKIIRTM